METTVKSTVYAKKLREHLKKLKQDYAKDMEAYDRAVELWKNVLTGWIKVNAVQRVAHISKSELQGFRGFRSHERGFDTTLFFAGAPKPPTRPSNKQICDIQNVLRHLAITGQATVRLSTADVAKLLGDSSYEDD